MKSGCRVGQSCMEPSRGGEPWGRQGLEGLSAVGTMGWNGRQPQGGMGWRKAGAEQAVQGEVGYVRAVCFGLGWGLGHAGQARVGHAGQGGKGYYVEEWDFAGGHIVGWGTEDMML